MDKTGDIERYDLIEELLESSCLIVDIMPGQVPAERGERYFETEEYFLEPERLKKLRVRYAELLLKLSCYFDMDVSFDAGETREGHMKPEDLVMKLSDTSGPFFFRAIFENEGVMVDLDSCDTWMAVYGEGASLLKILKELAASEGLFVWSPAEYGR